MVDETRLEQMAIQSTAHSFELSSNQIKPIPLLVGTGEDVEREQDLWLTVQSPLIKN